ncbi:Histidine-specific methyltransferase, SAM-dependent [Phaffia rhodozyma]|uniref:Histidine-specific methyltransferase, SAM-dependent n=1 Tax=Phaffia rhodozyma TaxID=264483 RepID=A0A0F7SKU7_PHARH|nr:Histidine-specific methyltransferase, SAM-dependent [Phaffia rhodozyma]
MVLLSSSSQQRSVLDRIHDLRDRSPPSKSLLAQIRNGLGGTQWVNSDGENHGHSVGCSVEDGYRYRRSLPTMLFYDDVGLKLYEKITTDCPSYYLYPVELSLLKAHSREIVSLLFPNTAEEQKKEPEKNRKDPYPLRKGPVKRWRVADWGSADVGVHNGGVNGHVNGQKDGRKSKNMLGGVVLELGAGSLSKTSHFLKALAERSHGEKSEVKYFALDLDQAELDRTLSSLDESSLGPIMAQGNVTTGGVCGTYDVGLQWIQQGGHLADSMDSTSNSNPVNSNTYGEPIHYLFLGSSLGNFDREGAIEFLRSIPLRPGSGDRLVVGLDGRNEKEVVERAYNDPEGVTRAWAENMWSGVEREIGWKGPGRMKDSWTYEGRYNVPKGRHEAYFRSNIAQTITIPASKEGDRMSVQFDAGELVNIEWSYKYSLTEALSVFASAGLRPITRFPDSQGRYNLWVLERPVVTFSPTNRILLKSESGGQTSLGQPDGKGLPGIPTVDDWEDLWRFWDLITIGMIREEVLHEKPIDLRHKCLFYLGHIPTFLDIFLSRHLKEPHSEPEYYKDLFERGIDPNVDDPEQCHSHSIVPEKDEDWPSLEDILQFRNRVRERLIKIYEDCQSGKRQMDRRLGRIIFMTYEHEVMHAETLLYMLIQSPKTLPPPGFASPSFSTLARLWDAQHERDAQHSTIANIPATEITLGHKDLEEEDGKYRDQDSWRDHVFGWDNENGVHTINVGAFRIERKGITNGEYRSFLKQEFGGDDASGRIPKSWIDTDGEWKVKTVYGPVSFAIAQHWPLMASYDEHLAFAKSRGGRLPTEAELRVWLDKFPEGDRTDWEGSNTGLKNWHPVPAEMSYTDSTGLTIPGHNGGVWEWTSTPMKGHPAQQVVGGGYVPSELYPGYSSDFFDEVHHVVLGGSFVTLPYFAGRRTVRNFYQHNYPFAWVGARVCYDI